MEVVDLGEGEGDVDDAEEVQKKRDSGYSYRRPANHALASRARFQVGQSSHGGRIVNRHPGQINKPVTKYGPPGYQNSSPTRLTSLHGQQHRDKLQFHGHFGQQHSSNFDGRPGGGLPFEQEIPSPIRQVDFVEPNPISTQNDEPFAGHSANYLPPHNQKLPGPSTPQIFVPVHQGQQQQLVNFHNRDVAQPQGHISDAALFLSQNAQAIQQLYGAPPNEQDFAPNADQFLGHANQASRNPNGQLENFEATSQTPQNFPAPLPSYASGTLTAQETLQQIQSLEKDRLIAQLQHALATQSQPQNVAVDVAGRYAQNQPGFVQNQDLLASIGQRITKFHGLNARPSTVNFGSGNTAFNQSPFLPGTTIGPGFPLSYGPLSTTVRPSTTTATTTSTTATTTTVQPPQPAKPDGTSQVASSLPAPPAPLPVYGGFVPFLAGTAFLSNVPSYGPAFLAPGPLTPVHSSSSTSSPTHFGLPIPTDHKPATGNTPAPPTSSTTPPANRPASPPTSLHPVPTTPLHPVAPLHPVTPLHPVQPVLPPTTHAHPPSTTNPGYGLQTAVINPLLYKPIKPVYPFYYYQNVAYQVPKPSALPTYPWSYAPTYAQAKPTQIW